MDRAAYSSYGYGLDILAPGSTLSTSGSDLGFMTGTSVATAEVTGAVSQVWAANPALSYAQVKDIIKLTATDLSSPGYDLETGKGLLNLAAAVLLAKVTQPDTQTTPAIPAPSTWGGAGQVTPTERAAFTAVNWSGQVTATPEANIRSTPNRNNPVVGSLPYGATVSFDGWTLGEYIDYSNIGLGATDKWYRIAGTNGTQWISGALINTVPPVVVSTPVANRTPYVIKPGDTLWAIAQARLGNGTKWTNISKDAAGTQFFTEDEARRLQIDQVVYLPVNWVTPGTPPVSPPPPQPAPISGWQNPLPGYPITSGYGPRRLDGYHWGIDVGAPSGISTKAANSGKVVYAGWNNQGYGNLIIIEHPGGIRTYYAHLSQISVSVGQQVTSGAVIGKVGSTGNSTGPHLHIEVRVAPYQWQKDNRNPANYIKF